MKVTIAYPVPLDSPEVIALFKPFVQRFTDSLRELHPGHEYTLAAILNGGTESDIAEAKRMFHDLPVIFVRYLGAGADIGSFQFYAKLRLENEFLVCCVTRVYAWKAGWLRRLVSAREAYGNGLFATSISREGGKLHACCRCYAFDTEDFKKYPTEIVSRDQGVFFEVGDGCLLHWFKAQGLPTRVVYWDECPEILDFSGAFCQSLSETFRRGEQRRLLVRDKHSDLYSQASPEEKARLERLCFGVDSKG